jgi:uncharacterized protein
VLEVDLQRQRIALTMRMGDEPTQGKRHDNAPVNRGNPNPRQQQRSSSPPPSGNAMAAAFSKLRK